MDLTQAVSGVIVTSVATTAEATHGTVGSDEIGIIVMAVILSPVVVISAAAIFDSPRTFRVPALFVGAVVGLIGAMVAAVAAFGAVLKLIVPQ